ncbi:C45 family autoproteolytic acyltransferase/hydrolase [Streptomyces sp. BH097]|uniref:C45 family autoproteolytic acyltransferase/hydolase n=1 Tax=unclassified Streptomyces TaxID=2593676 RepID=UPI003BB56391
MGATVREQQLAGLRWLVVSGGRDDAFRALGEAARADIRAVQEAMPEREALRRTTAGGVGAARLERVVGATRSAFPDELAELAALAEGAAVPFDDLLLANLRGDLGVDDGTGCTDLGLRGDSGSFVAHNEDGAPALDGRMMLLTLLLDGHAPVTAQWYPGFVPANAFTATGHGLVWGINHVQVVRPGPGAGRHFVARALQQAPTLDAALDLLRTRPSAGGFAYTLGERGTGRVVVAETAAGRTAVRETGAGELHWHTNHLRLLPYAPDAALATGGEGATAGLGQYAESAARGRALERLRPGDATGAEWFEAALTSAPLPDGVHRTAAGDDPLMTLCTTVADLGRNRITVRGARGERAELPLSAFTEGALPAAR